MNIQKIEFSTGNNINFQNNKKSYTQPIRRNPVQEGLKTAVIWLGFGLGFDYVCKKCVVFKNSPIKNSLFVNTTLAIFAGVYTAIESFIKNK